MKVFVTGGTGFIGGSLIRQLREAGHEVIALVRDPNSLTAKSLAELRVTLAKGDVTDKDSMRAPMKGVDGVFHVAGWYQVGSADRKAATAINIDGTRNVLELMKELKVPRGVYTSTLATHGDTKGQLPDESYINRAGFGYVYEESKWRAHHEVAIPFIKEGLPLTIVLPGVVYGPGDISATGQALKLHLRGLLPIYPVPATFCWAYVDDTARGCILAMEKGKPGESYIIGGPVYRLGDVLKMASSMAGLFRPMISLPKWFLRLNIPVMALAGKILPVPDPYSAESMQASLATNLGSSAKAERELGWSARPLEQGLRETLRYELPRLGIKPRKAL